MGNMSGTSGSHYTLWASITENSYDVANNSSNVTIKLYLTFDGSSWYAYTNYTTYGEIQVDRWTEGTLASLGTYSIASINFSSGQAKDLLLAEWTDNISHNPNGSRTVNVSCSWNTDTTKIGSGSCTASLKLTDIPRYTTVYNSLRGRTSSSISINWSTTDARDYTQYSLNGGSWTDAGDTVASDNKSGYYTISGLAANTSYTVKTRCRRTDSGLWSEATTTISTSTYAKTTPTISLSSKTSSSITVTSGCNVSVSSTQYRIKTSSGSYGAYQTSGTFSGLSANTTYTIEVYKVGSDSGESGTATISVTTYQTTVASISLSSKTSSSITVTSSCNVTVSSTQYRIKISSGSYGSYQTSATFSGLSANTTYVVEVKKVGSASGEADTATVTVTTYAKTTPTISLSSKSVNSITVTSGCNVTVSSTKYRIKTSNGSYGSYQTGTTFSGLTPNTAYVIEVYKVGTESGESGTATLSVTTYNYATISAATNFNLGDSHTITYSNPMGSSVGALQACLSFDGSKDDIVYRDISKTGTSYTFSFTDTELDTLYKKYGTENTIVVTSYLRTDHNNMSYYSTKNITVTLTGNQKTARTNVSSSWKRGKIWTNVNGTWKRAVVWTNVNGTWKRGI